MVHWLEFALKHALQNLMFWRSWQQHGFKYTLFFIRKIFISLENHKTLRKCYENLQSQMPELQFLKREFFLELY